MGQLNGKLQGESGVWCHSTSHKNDRKARRQSSKAIRRKAKKQIRRELAERREA